jgi:hypothetical protein
MEPIMTAMRTFATTMCAVVILAISNLPSSAASEFEGTWKVADTKGNAFEISLAGDGSAKADRAGEGMIGTWKEEGTAAVITWDTGWTTKISKEGAQYTKTAFKKGDPVDSKAANSSPAEKIK